MPRTDLQIWLWFTWFFAWRFAVASLMGAVVGGLIVKRVPAWQGNARKEQRWNIMLAGSPVFLLTLFLIGALLSLIEARTSPRDWDFSGAMMGIHLALILWSLPLVLAPLHLLAGIFVKAGRRFLIAAGLYAASFFIVWGALRWQVAAYAG